MLTTATAPIPAANAPSHTAVAADRLRVRLQQVHAEIALEIADPRLDPQQRALIGEFFARQLGRRAGLFADPAAIALVIAAAEGQDGVESSLRLAAGAGLYYLALRIFDDVHDEELVGLAAELGPAVTSNAALALYTIACDLLLSAVDEAPAAARRGLRRALLDHSLIAAGAQHRDLIARAPEDLGALLLQARQKSAVFALICECAAHSAGADAARVAGYRAIGEASATMRQLANDIRDIFGKGLQSDDLENRRWTLPVAALLEVGDVDTCGRFHALVDRLPDPGALATIRRLMVECGAIHRLAALMEGERRRIHAIAGEMDRDDGPFAVYLEFVDAMAAELYRRPASRP
ncbi:MAG: hypothetical protein R3B09_00765 [Nannocystaceae bacterium]